MENNLSSSSSSEGELKSEINKENDSSYNYEVENLPNEPKQCDTSENDDKPTENNACLSNSDLQDSQSSLHQPLSESTTHQNVEDSNEFLNCHDTVLECVEKSSIISDSESCSSSNDSVLEPNTDSLTTESTFSQDNNKQNYKSPDSSKTSQYLHTDEYVKSLETHNLTLEKEILELKKFVLESENSFKRLESKIRNEFLADIEKLSKECHTLRKDKEAMVVRYAKSERDVIIEKKVNQEMEKKMKEIIKERDNLSIKLKNLNIENNKLSSLNDSKMVEIAKLQKSFEKLSSDFNAREVRIKWLQNNLKTEMNSHQETQTKLDHTVKRLNEMKEEAEQLRKDCQEMIKCYQEGEETKSVKLDSQLKEKLSELEVQKQEKSDQEQVYHLLRQELEALKKKQRLTMEENNSLVQKVLFKYLF